MTPAEVRAAIARFPTIPLVSIETPVEPLLGLSAALGGGPRLLVKRDDVIPFGFGGNKVRKASFVAARARAEGADTLVTAGGIQSNHARVTAAAAARLGMRAVLVVNGVPSPAPTGNLLLDRLLGAEVVFVPSRGDREPMMHQIAERLRRDGRRPFEIPIGASVPLGALAFVLASAELADQTAPPDVIVHASSSGGTQAGLSAGCRLLGWSTRVIGISADEPAPAVRAVVRRLIDGVADLMAVDPSMLAEGATGTMLEVDDRFVGDGYGLPTAASGEAIELLARTEGLFLDPTYTAKAMAALIAYVRRGHFDDQETILFWHTGGQPGLFA